ncbi:MAG TPA: DUF6069 family protein [Rugosimonospora sp.]|nr:DUF6069 family protein [Rugosimonospora sp.]
MLRRYRQPARTQRDWLPRRDGRDPSAQLTLAFSLAGVGFAAAMARTVRRPRPTFTRTAVAPTALSVVPDLTAGFDAGSTATLTTPHTVAAAIVYRPWRGGSPALELNQWPLRVSCRESSCRGGRMVAVLHRSHGLCSRRTGLGWKGAGDLLGEDGVW